MRIISDVVLQNNEEEDTYLTQQKQSLLVKRQKIIKHEHFEDFHVEFKNFIQDLHQEFDKSYNNRSSGSRLFLVNKIGKSTQVVQCLYISKMEKIGFMLKQTVHSLILKLFSRSFT